MPGAQKPAAIHTEPFSQALAAAATPTPAQPEDEPLGRDELETVAHRFSPTLLLHVKRARKGVELEELVVLTQMVAHIEGTRHLFKVLDSKRRTIYGVYADYKNSGLHNITVAGEDFNG